MTNYRGAGVDFESIGSFRRNLISAIRYKGDKYMMASEIGHYAGLVKFKDGFLALHTDGVGTKTIYAMKFDYFDEIGFDLVGMNVNDIVSIGAEPIALVDYVASSVFSPELGLKIGKSINKACERARTPLIGGETASIPDIIKGIDISATVVGFLGEDRIIDGSRIKDGDAIIGLASSGIHSNGFSLIRKIYDKNEKLLYEEFMGIPLWKVLLKGTTIYSSDILHIIEKCEIHGLAHITGGGLRNLNRLSRKKFLIDNFKINPLFLKIKEDGKLDLKDMFETFNMGYGYIIIAPNDCYDLIANELKTYNPEIIGRVEKGEEVELKQFGITYKGYY